MIAVTVASPFEASVAPVNSTSEQAMPGSGLAGSMGRSPSSKLTVSTSLGGKVDTVYLDPVAVLFDSLTFTRGRTASPDDFIYFLRVPATNPTGSADEVCYGKLLSYKLFARTSA